MVSIGLQKGIWQPSDFYIVICYPLVHDIDAAHLISVISPHASWGQMCEGVLELVAYQYDSNRKIAHEARRPPHLLPIGFQLDALTILLGSIVMNMTFK